MNRYTLFISQDSRIEILKREGIGSNITLQVDDAEIRIPEEKLKEIWQKIGEIMED